MPPGLYVHIAPGSERWRWSLPIAYPRPSEVLTEGTSQFSAIDDEAKRIHLGESFSLG